MDSHDKDVKLFKKNDFHKGKTPVQRTEPAGKIEIYFRV